MGSFMAYVSEKISCLAFSLSTVRRMPTLGDGTLLTAESLLVAKI